MRHFDAFLMAGLKYGALALAVWAFVDALIRPANAYVATGKLTKPAWVGITAVAGLVIKGFGLLSFLGLPAVIAAVVYLVDVRPAVRGLSSGNSW
ncbi:DUF2516 domain-containing protein [Blastococcus sp. TF02-8]|uniref:DUF2516 family protein n=1 Tax=Blastococcus sp. TF02-8 TaxID=2250574 RepID=UPI000DE9D676|nr:DUF2516 family protein [Blastococcus sp. TF02-8]RBY97173.1 DUF2516 domain-containing protein [Blastococcus sp. TF02-8]